MQVAGGGSGRARSHLSVVGRVLALLALVAVVAAGGGVTAARAQAPEPEPAPAASGPASGSTSGPTGGLALLGAPPRAALLVDGKAAAVTPLLAPLRLGPGAHAVLLKRPGFRSFEAQVEIFAERVVALEVEMPRTAGVLVVTAKAAAAPARVFVDGTPRGEAPLELEVGQGPHQVRVQRDGFYEDTFQFEAVLGEETVHEAQLRELPPNVNPYRRLEEKKPWYTRWWVWTLAAVGAAGVATAVIVPAVLSSRSDCQKLGGEVCFPVQVMPTEAAMPAPQALISTQALVPPQALVGTAGLSLRF